MRARSTAERDDPELDALVRNVFAAHQREDRRAARQSRTGNVVYPGEWPHPSAGATLYCNDEAAQAFLTWTAIWLRDRPDGNELLRALGRLAGPAPIDRRAAATASAGPAEDDAPLASAAAPVGSPGTPAETGAVETPDSAQPHADTEHGHD